MKSLLEDLVFFIGSFFLIVAVLLFLAGMTQDANLDPYHLNYWTGSVFLIFSLGMITKSIKTARRN